MAAVLPSKPDTIFRLGVWLSGLQSFTDLENHSFAEGNRSKASKRSWKKEFHLTDAVLHLCSHYALQLLRTLQSQKVQDAEETDTDQEEKQPVELGSEDFSFAEISELSTVIKNLIHLNKAALRSEDLSINEWAAWSAVLDERLQELAVVKKIVGYSEDEGEKFLPAAMFELLQKKAIPFELEVELRAVLPRIARILKWLSVVDEMRQKDMPLKPALLLFARINEQIKEMMDHINNRLLRFGNEDSDIFASLDGASYVASIEIKKVFNHGLAGVAEMRQTPLIFAKIETGYALLNDCFQQTIVNFAQILDSGIQAKQLYPQFQDKLEQSLTLRSELWTIQKAVQKAEHDIENYPMDKLHSKLTDFMQNAMHYLMYKDRETVERFVEEVLRTKGKNDIVPILHRFGAYIETLLGQVNMRTVLADHPFDYPQD